MFIYYAIKRYNLSGIRMREMLISNKFINLFFRQIGIYKYSYLLKNTFEIVI